MNSERLRVFRREQLEQKDLDNRFDYHPPTGGKIRFHEDVRTAFKILANVINQVPVSREQSPAITALEESMFWTNAAIARNEIK
jgi:hypothetical protein